MYMVEACWNVSEGWIYCCILVTAKVSTVRFLLKYFIRAFGHPARE